MDDKKTILEDASAYLQVFGCLMKDSTLVDDLDRPLQRDDFDTHTFYKLLYVAIYNIHMNGAQIVDEYAVDSYIKNYPEQYKIFNDNQGIVYLSKAIERATLDNYDMYYHKVRKLSLLRYYDKKGYDIKNIYNYTLKDGEFEKEQMKFEEMSEQDIVDYVENNMVLEPRTLYCANILTENKQAGDGLKYLVDSFLESPDYGYEYASLALSSVVRGAIKGKFYLFSAGTGTGKAIPNYTKIPTPNGHRKVGDIRPGDYLFDRTGKPTKVLQIHPQIEKKEIWKITFKDGRVAECCKDHLWEYYVEGHRGMTKKIATTEELYKLALSHKNGFKNNERKGFRYKIKMNQAVEYSEKEYSVHPYVMGAFLGNGSFRYDKSQKGMSFSSNDLETVEKIACLLGEDIIYHKNKGRNYNYTFKPKHNLKHNLWVEEIFYEYPELWNVISPNKHIPYEYLLGSVEQRFELLNGLLDTDGSTDSKGRVCYSTTSEQLRDDIIELVRSLGMIATYRVDKRDKYTKGEGYVINISCSKENKIKLFSLTRKKKLIEEYVNNKKRTEKNEFLPIVNIEKTNVTTEMTCFTVDNKEHLFLMNDYIVTHNTRNFLMNATHFAVPYVWSKKDNKFIYTGQSVPTLFVGTEGSIDEFQTIVLATVSGVDESHIRKGQYKEGEYERIIQASEYIEASPLYLVYCDDYSITDIENIAKRYVLTYKVEIFIFDYLQSSMRLTAEIANNSKVRMQEWQILLIFSTRMKALAQRLEICIISGTQLSADANEAKYKDNLILQGSKAISQKVDVGIVISRPNTAERKKIEALTRNMINVPEVNMLYWIYKIRGGELSRIILCANINLGTMTIKDCFITDFDFNLIDVDITKIELVEKMIQENSIDIAESGLRDTFPQNEIEEYPTTINQEKKQHTSNFDW